MTWVDINGTKLKYIEGNGFYSIVKMNDDGETIPFASARSPLSTNLSSNSTFYKALYNLRPAKYSDDYFSSDLLPQWVEELFKNKTTEEEQAIEEEKKNELAQQKEQKELSEKYGELHAVFDYYCRKNNMTPLEFIVSVSRCLCADSVREVVRAFVGFFLTYKKFRATNVIAIGSASSGKSFILETALSMCPQEKVHRGIMSPASFFREFDGQNLDGWVFYLGDLGGIKDDEKTIQFRDILKELTTDGEVVDTIAKDNSDTEVIERRVTGKPAIWYSTAREETVNEQEKSRSIILTPQDVDSELLVIFNTVWENNGNFYKDITELLKMRESIKGFVFDFIKGDYDYFNPYLFNVKDALEDTDDFNRKIQEFDATLEVVSLLSKPYIASHQHYYDDENNHKDTEIVFSSKRDNLNAINLFDAINFLPDEARFGDMILQEYDVFDLSECGNIDQYVDVTFEDKVMGLLKSDQYGYDSREEFNPDKAYDIRTGQCNLKHPLFKDNWFTISTLKRDHRRKKWFKRNREYLSQRLYKLSEEGILLKIGKDGKENVYCLNDVIGTKISEKLPDLDNKKNLEKSRELFEKLFPNNLEDYDLFIEMDNESEENTESLTESIVPIFPDLPYLRGGFDV